MLADGVEEAKGDDIGMVQYLCRYGSFDPFKKFFWFPEIFNLGYRPVMVNERLLRRRRLAGF